MSNINFDLVGCGGDSPEIFIVCLGVDSSCWVCIYSNIFVIGR